MNKKKLNIANIVSSIFLGLGIVFLLLSVFMIFQKIKKDNMTIKIPAVISDSYIVNNGDSKSEKFLVTYSYDGQEYSNIPINYSYFGMEKGYQLEIRINPDDPTKIYSGGVILIFFLVLFGCGFSYLGVYTKKELKLDEDTNANDSITYYYEEQSDSTIQWERASISLSGKLSRMINKKRKISFVGVIVATFIVLNFVGMIFYLIFSEMSGRETLFEFIIKALFLLLLFTFLIVWIKQVFLPIVFSENYANKEFYIFNAKCHDVGKTRHSRHSSRMTKHYGYFEKNENYIVAEITYDEYQNPNVIGEQFIFYKANKNVTGKRNLDKFHAIMMKNLDTH